MTVRLESARIFRAILLTIFVLTTQALWSGSEDDEYVPLGIGDVAPPFKEELVTSGEIDLAHLRGKVVLLNLWATWCDPCKEEIPMFLRLRNEFEGRLEIVGAAVFSKTRDLQKFISDYKMNYPVILGYYDLMGRYNKVSAVPTTFVIGKDGRLLGSFVGMGTEAQYRTLIERGLRMGTS